MKKLFVGVPLYKFRSSNPQDVVHRLLFSLDWFQIFKCPRKAIFSWTVMINCTLSDIDDMYQILRIFAC